MTILEFASESPWLTFFLAFILMHSIIMLIKYPLRALNIRKHGWPPENCDADGDFRQKEDK